MLTTRRSVTCAAYLVFAFGCSESQETGPRGVPVEDNNGRIVDNAEGAEPLPVTSTASGNVAQLPAPDDAETRQHPQDEWRNGQEEQARRDRQEEELAQKEATRKLLQEWKREAQASLKDYSDQESYRRLARELAAPASQRAGASRQQEAGARWQQEETAGWRRIQHQQDVMLLNSIRSGMGGGVDDRYSRPIDP